MTQLLASYTLKERKCYGLHFINNLFYSVFRTDQSVICYLPNHYVYMRASLGGFVNLLEILQNVGQAIMFIALVSMIRQR